ncbi:MAG: ATP-binding protein [Actinomycetota bacterium]
MPIRVFDGRIIGQGKLVPIGLFQALAGDYDHTSCPTLLGADTGLGLIGIRERVSQSGGHLTVSSRPGRGTVIQVSMPTHLCVPDESVGASA